VTRSIQDILRVGRLASEGHSQKRIARETGIARATVRDWLSEGIDPLLARRISRPARGDARLPCELHNPPDPPAEAYAYLLGAYLGDGSLSLHAKEVYRLRIFCTAAYSGIIDEIAAAASAIVPTKVSLYKQKTAECVEVSSYSRHWFCFLPQHGRGMKHLRPILLESWQSSIVDAYPGPFVKGLIHSDGCRIVNRVKGGEYPRYQFSNRSADIRGLFIDACERMGINVSRNSWWSLSVARRDDVEFLDSFIGPKR
jgi:Homeodomain-like domain-containing protein